VFVYMRIRIRTPNGGESVFFVDEKCNVESLRNKIQWCIDNKDWSNRNSVKLGQDSASPSMAAKAPDEMWSLNDPSNEINASSSADDFEALNDFESVMSHSCEVHDCERNHIQLLYGTQLLEVSLVLHYLFYGLCHVKVISSYFMMQSSESSG
jgi:hypothetical protein